jgi:hypothetical protein
MTKNPHAILKKLRMSMTWPGAARVSSPTLLTLTASKLELEHLRLFQKIGVRLLAVSVI